SFRFLTGVVQPKGGRSQDHRGGPRLLGGCEMTSDQTPSDETPPDGAPPDGPPTPEPAEAPMPATADAGPPGPIPSEAMGEPPGAEAYAHEVPTGESPTGTPVTGPSQGDVAYAAPGPAEPRPVGGARRGVTVPL